MVMPKLTENAFEAQRRTDAAKVKVFGALIDATEQHNLSSLEIVRLLQELQDREIGYLIRAERGEDD